MQRSYSYFKRLGAISAIILSVLGIAIMLFFPDKIIKFLPASTYYLVLDKSCKSTLEAHATNQQLKKCL